MYGIEGKAQRPRYELYLSGAKDSFQSGPFPVCKL